MNVYRGGGIFVSRFCSSLPWHLHSAAASNSAPGNFICPLCGYEFRFTDNPLMEDASGNAKQAWKSHEGSRCLSASLKCGFRISSSALYNLFVGGLYGMPRLTRTLPPKKKRGTAAPPPPLSSPQDQATESHHSMIHLMHRFCNFSRAALLCHCLHCVL